MEIVLWILGVLVLAVGIAISIGLHELGHFYPARKFGVFVGSFMIGFGPTLWSRKFGETEFGFKAIPLGGYVSLSGMYPTTANANKPGFRMFRKLVQEARDASAETITDDSRAFYRLPVLQRIIVMLGGPVMNLVIASVLFVFLFTGIGVVGATTTIGSISECVLPVTSSRTTCESGDPKAPAAEAGLKPGDRLVSIAGQPVTTWESGTAIIRESAEREITIVVERGGQELSLAVTPMATVRYALDASGSPIIDAEGNPETATVGFVGVGPAVERQQQSPLVALDAMGNNIVQVGALILDLPNRMIQVWNAAFGAETRDPNGPVSVVGVGRIAGDIAAAEQIDLGDRVAALIGILASLNIALFVFNLIPLLPLDGGHIVVALWQGFRNAVAKLRGKPEPGPVDSARLVPFTIVITVLLMAMSALLIYADIVKPITLGL
jgi:membrane-associated protease RseP (regulator of RpoE activity)